ncbi:hypothetical protein EAF04_006074 [Stromatinia cepivora]|nr:hypothetical protein EAF04_006074 [Stromatinia cepivora]
MQPSPPPYTPRVNVNANTIANSTGYELTLQTYSDGFWHGPIDTFEGADAIHIPEEVCRRLRVSANELGVEKFVFSITDPDRKNCVQWSLESRLQRQCEVF